VAASDRQSFWRSFAGGEISEELYGRLNLAHYQTGLSLAENFMVLPHGPVVNRAGSRYVIETKFSTKASRLIPFIRDETIALMLEVGDQYIRFHRDTGTVLEALRSITGITQASVGVVTSTAHGYSNGDWVFLQDILGMTELNGRFAKIVNVATNTFEIQGLDGGNINTTSFAAYVSSGQCGKVYEVATSYDESVIDLLDIHYTQSVDTITLTHPTYPERELTRTADNNWALTAIDFAPDLAAPANVVASNTGSGTEVYRYAVTAISAETLKETYKGDSNSVTNQVPVGDRSKSNGITWNAVVGAVRYNVYKELQGGGDYFFIGQTVNTNFRDYADHAPDFTKAPPEDSNPFTGAGKYPSTVSYFEQRRAFAASIDEPQKLWATRSGTDDNMTSSLPAQDDDAFNFRMAAVKANAIRHLVTLKDMLVFTAGAVWRVLGADSSVVTPNNVDIRVQEHVGATNVQPVTSGDTAIYAASRGEHIRVVRYENDAGGYITQDVSLLAPHLVDGFTIKDMAFSDSPYRMWWGVRSDGRLLSLTYVPEQEVLGWHTHTTANGTYESVSVIPESGADSVYVIVKRTIDGRPVRYVERFAQRNFATLADSFIVDSGLTYSGAATTTISGLYHLEGQTVSILADGAVVPQQVVTDGAVTLAATALKVHVGIPIIADLETLPLAYEARAGGFGFASPRNINSLRIRVKDSAGIKAGPNVDKLREYAPRTNEPWGSPPSWKSGIIDISLDPEWADDGKVVVRQDQPLPVMITAMLPEFAEG